MAKDSLALQNLLDPTVTALGFELWGCVYQPQDGRGLLRIYIDSEQGIRIEDCEKVSRQISALLDVEDPILSAYTLEVSSPGLNRPLFTLAQFRKFIGANVNIRLHMPLDNRKQFRGLLKEISEDTLIIEIDGQTFSLPFTSIAKANLIVHNAAKD